MSRELWAVERCVHGKVQHMRSKCMGGQQWLLDFDAIWARYYETANRRSESGLTHNELWEVVYGEKKEEE